MTAGRRILTVALAGVAILWPLRSRATLPGTFGQGPRSAGLVRADVADGDALSAGQQNAALAATPGLRFSLGYSFGALSLQIDDREIGPRAVSGVDLALQYGRRLGKEVVLGLEIDGHVPDRHIARVAFRPATEPQFVRYESSLSRTSLDTVVALSWRGFSLGGGAAATLDVGGDTDFTLGQDGSGTYADAATDIDLPYHLAPLVGARADLGPVVLGAQFRGALGVDLRLVAVNRVDLVDNPLNGSTTVLVDGTSGYDPAVIDFGARVALGAGVSVHAAFEYAVWSAAPSPAADVSIDVVLQTSPTLREASFGEPRFRDTISPRFGVELLRGDAPGEEDEADRKLQKPRPAGDPRASVAAEPEPPVRGLFGETLTARHRWRYALRAGYVLSPSPVPPQTGFTSYADATRHGFALGAALRIGRWAGVDVAAGLAGQLHVLAERQEKKPNLALPYARYDVSGKVFFGTLGVEATWR